MFIFSFIAGISNDWLAWNAAFSEVEKALQRCLGSDRHSTWDPIHYLLCTHLGILGPQFPRKFGSAATRETIESVICSYRRVKKKFEQVTYSL